MKYFALFVTSCVAALAASPAFAQQDAGPAGPGPYGHHMWAAGMGWHPGAMLFSMLIMLFAVIGFFALIGLTVRCCRHHCHGGYGRGGCPICGRGQSRAALDILDERLAKGEIEKGEFEEKSKLLGR